MPVHGPYRHRNRWRIVVTIPGEKPPQRAFSYASEAEAHRAIKKAKADYGAEGRTVEEAVREFLAASDIRDTTRTTNSYRLCGLFRLDEGDKELSAVTVAVARGLYTKRVKETRADTHHAELFLAAQLLEWCISQGWVKDNPFLEVEPVGRKSPGGKKQLRVDESKRFLEKCFAEETKEGLACAAALLLGVRASELTDRVVRDLDDNGRLLWIPHAKSRAGVRSLEIPECLRVGLVALTAGKKQDERLWGNNSRGKPCDRHWLEHHTRRIASAARVPDISPHGLRGLHSTLARVNGVSAEVVASALGHSSIQVTKAKYIAPGTEQREAARKVADRLGR